MNKLVFQNCELCWFANLVDPAVGKKIQSTLKYVLFEGDTTYLDYQD